MVVLVTGANGQLGQSLQFIAKKHPNIEFVFCDSKQLDITNLKSVKQVFKQFKPNFCINTAAYTAVDKAETEAEKATLINVIGPKNVAATCKEYNTILLHVSTDFVFDGNQNKAYTEDDVPNPTGIYGRTKLQGEQAIQSTWEKHFIIRTSWVYSQFGNNFLKTMLRLAKERDTISVVNDQIGSPTYAKDLAIVILKLILKLDTKQVEIVHYSNSGKCSWFQFAQEIINNAESECKVLPISSEAFNSKAFRPNFSLLNTEKIKKSFQIRIPNWKDSLKDCMIKINSNS